MPLFVKIIVSLGPASDDVNVVTNMIRLGVSGFRINFAHGTPEDWARYVKTVRSLEDASGRPLAIIGDLQGPSLRIGKLEKPVVLRRGEIIKIVYGSEASGGEDKRAPIPIHRFFDVVEEGDIVVMDDGKTRLRVTGVYSDHVEAIALTDSVITSKKAVTIRGKDIDLPILTESDFNCVKFALEHGFDYLGISYVRSGSDIDVLREYLKRIGRDDVGIIAKIETRSAIENLDEILERSDVVLIARGDLGMSFGLEEIHALQSRIAEKALEMRRPVIIATQLLESMVEKPVPTRAEVVDVSTAIEMGVDALMLTGETSIGKYPVEAVSWLIKIANFTEREILKRGFKRIIEKARSSVNNIQVMFAKGVLELAEDLNAKLLVFSIHGNTAKRISSLKPSIPVYVGSPNITTLRRLAILWGLQLMRVDAQEYDEGLQKSLQKAIELGYVSIGDLVITTYGLREPRQKVEIQRIVS
jgi:pyruvate kinase